jgi:hypothetical protein
LCVYPMLIARILNVDVNSLVYILCGYVPVHGLGR